MKAITMFETSWCPYCKKARDFMDELKQENPEFKNLEVNIIDEELEPEISRQYSYYYVPTYYIEDEKEHEGVPSKEIILRIFNKAMTA